MDPPKNLGLGGSSPALKRGVLHWQWPAFLRDAQYTMHKTSQKDYVSRRPARERRRRRRLPRTLKLTTNQKPYHERRGKKEKNTTIHGRHALVPYWWRIWRGSRRLPSRYDQGYERTNERKIERISTLFSVSLCYSDQQWYKNRRGRIDRRASSRNANDS